MKNLNTLLLLLLSVSIFYQCKTKNIAALAKTDTAIDLTANYQVYFLDSTSAASAIAADANDLFFERITLAEMNIQMKQNRSCQSRDECVEGYKNFLSSDVENFNEADKRNIEQVFNEVGEMLKKVNPKLIDRNIRLIKTKGRHYGPGVYYTRENAIIIPKDVLDSFDKESFKQTMLHEFFHVFSRYNPSTRDSLYGLIGFYPIEDRLILPLALSERKLLNPDGTTDYMIRIGESLAYPLITTTSVDYLESKPAFFNYLEFKLYKLLPGVDGVLHVGNEIPFQNAGDFFRQIKDNTDYIIHPDEIMADNFVYAVYNAANGSKIKDFSSEGMALIDRITSVLKTHNW